MSSSSTLSRPSSPQCACLFCRSDKLQSLCPFAAKGDKKEKEKKTKKKKKKEKEKEKGVQKKEPKRKKEKRKKKRTRQQEEAIQSLDLLRERLKKEIRQFVEREKVFNSKLKEATTGGREALSGEYQELKKAKETIIEHYQEALKESEAIVTLLGEEEQAIEAKRDRNKKKRTKNQTALEKEQTKLATLRQRLIEAQQKQAQSFPVPINSQQQLEEGLAASILNEEQVDWVDKQYQFYKDFQSEMHDALNQVQELESQATTYKTRHSELKSKLAVLTQEKQRIQCEQRDPLEAAQAQFIKNYSYLDHLLEQLLQDPSLSSQPESGDISVIEIEGTPSQKKEPSSCGGSLIDILNPFSEEEVALSEDDLSNALTTQLATIRDRLLHAHYDDLRNEFSAEWQRFFLNLLIDMYKRGQRARIESEASLLIGYMLGATAQHLVALYHYLKDPTLSADAKKQIILEYIQRAPSLSALNGSSASRKLSRLIQRIENTNDLLYTLRLIDTFLNNEEIPRPVSTAAAAGEAVVVVTVVPEYKEEKRRVEHLITLTLFDNYVVSDKKPLPIIDPKSCLYRLTRKRAPYEIRMARVTRYVEDETEQEALIYQMLRELAIYGFITLYQYFRLEHFPRSLLQSCRNLQYRESEPVYVYITEYVQLNLLEVSGTPQWSVDDKFCALFELLFALRMAKQEYAIQHNALEEYANLQFRKDAQARNYTVAGKEQQQHTCQSSLQICLTNFAYASIDEEMPREERALFGGYDYTVYKRLVLSPALKITESFNRRLSEKMLASPLHISFDRLLLFLLTLRQEEAQLLL